MLIAGSLLSKALPSNLVNVDLRAEMARRQNISVAVLTTLGVMCSWGLSPSITGFQKGVDKASPDACSLDHPTAVLAQGGFDPRTIDSEGSPFGFHPALPLDVAREMGVKWTRGSDTPYLFWSMVDPGRQGARASMRWKGPLIRPDGGPGFFDYDSLFQVDRAGFAMLHNIDVQPPEPHETHFQPASWLPTDGESYKEFVRASVRRYSFIKYWQVGNEPNLAIKSADYAQYQRMSYEAIKEADPSARVLMAGLAGNMDLFSLNDPGYEPVLRELNGRYLDIFDVHFYGDAKGGRTVFRDPRGKKSRLLGYRDFKLVYDYYRGLLDRNGFAHVPIWVTEMGTPSGESRFGPQILSQTEAEQARDLLKRHIYPMALGVQKIFWAFGILEGFGEWDHDFFDHTGLIYSGRDGIHQPGQRKLAYYTYRLMLEMLDGCDLSRIEAVLEDDVRHVYFYQFTKNGHNILVGWWDFFADDTYPSQKTRTIVLAGRDNARIKLTEGVPRYSSGREVSPRDYRRSFATKTVDVYNREISITIGENPVYLETLPKGSGEGPR